MQKLGKGLAGILPGGSLVTEFWHDFFGSPLKKRQADYLNRLAERIIDIERRLDTKLSDNDEFLDVLYQATAVAGRTSDSAKLDALCNFVLYNAQNPNIDDALESMLLDRISNCSAAHFYILTCFATHDDCEFKWMKYVSNYEQNETKWNAVKEDVYNMQLIDHVKPSDLGKLLIERIRRSDS